MTIVYQQCQAYTNHTEGVILCIMMYLNVNLAATASGVGAEGSCTTPRTPEILNLLAGGPFDNVGPFDSPSTGHSHSGGHRASGPMTGSNYNYSAGGSVAAASTPGDGPSSPREHASFSSLSSLSSPGTPSTPSSMTGPPSIQNTRTYLIKEGLKLTIQSKRLAAGRCSLENELSNDSPKSEEVAKLTVEDEERRRRRRERNKVAATKCRHRKKERTVILMQESDTLEDHNVNLRSEIQRLETEKRRLMDVLAMHSPHCVKPGHQTALGCTEYMSDVTGRSNPVHYNVIPPSEMGLPQYGECPNQAGSQPVVASHYNASCSPFDSRISTSSSVIPEISAQVSGSSFEMPCLGFSSDKCSSFHRGGYRDGGDNSGQPYR